MIIFLGRLPTVAATETEDLVCVRPNTRHAIHLHGVLLMARVLVRVSGILCCSVSHLGFIVLLLELAALSVTPGSVSPSFSSCCREMMPNVFSHFSIFRFVPTEALKENYLLCMEKARPNSKVS